jgi:predicted RNase H-like HicB family nuclease
MMKAGRQMVQKDIAYYMHLNYRVEILRDMYEGGYTLSCPELPGCTTHSDTLDHGMAMLETAKRSWFEVYIKYGDLIPEPNVEYLNSRQLVLHLPESLYGELAEEARKEGVSLNQLCITRLSPGSSAVRRRINESHSFIRGAEYYSKPRLL